MIPLIPWFWKTTTTTTWGSKKKGFVPSTSRAKIRVYRRKNREEEEEEEVTWHEKKRRPHQNFDLLVPAKRGSRRKIVAGGRAWGWRVGVRRAGEGLREEGGWPVRVSVAIGVTGCSRSFSIWTWFAFFCPFSLLSLRLPTVGPAGLDNFYSLITVFDRLTFLFFSQKKIIFFFSQKIKNISSRKKGFSG